MVKRKDDSQANDNFQKQSQSIQKKNVSKETSESRQKEQIDNTISHKGTITDKLKSGSITSGKSVAKVSGKSLIGIAKAGGKYVEIVSENADDEGVKLVSKGMKSSRQASQNIKKQKYRLLKRKVNKLKKEQAPPEKLRDKAKKTQKTALKKTNALARKSTKEISRQGFQATEKTLANADEEGVKLASQGMKVAREVNKKIKKASTKANEKQTKLQKKDLLSQKKFNKSKLTNEVRTEQKNALKKKNQRKKMYKSKQKINNSSFSTLSQRIGKIFQGITGKFKLSNLKDIVSTKIALWFGGSALFFLPIIFAGIMVVTIVLSFGLGNSIQESDVNGGGKNLDPDVKKWSALVETEAKSQGMDEYVQLLLAIIQVETGGRGTKDIMQSSESAGFPVNHWKTEEESVRQGVKHLKGIVDILKGYGKNYEKNYKLLAQAYNYGSAFASYVGKNGGEYTLQVSEDYSRKVVAPSLGNSIGLTYPYINEASKRLGKMYLYWNGGNFMYGEIVGQYIGGGGKDPSGILQPVLGQTLNNGECYGLSAYYVAKLGGAQMMGSGHSSAMLIGEDYDWSKYGWTVIMYPKFSDLRAGDVINWTAGGNLAPGIWGHTGVIKQVLNDGNFATFEQNAGKGRICAEYTRNVNMNQIRSIVRPPQ